MKKRRVAEATFDFNRESFVFQQLAGLVIGLPISIPAAIATGAVIQQGVFDSTSPSQWETDLFASVGKTVIANGLLVIVGAALIPKIAARCTLRWAWALRASLRLFKLSALLSPILAGLLVWTSTWR